MFIVSENLDEHKEVLLRDNPKHNKSWLANEHMRKFIGWLRDQISQSLDTQTSEYLKKLACVPIFTIVTYQGYDINGYTFYTEQQDKKKRTRIVVYVLMLMILWAKTKTCAMAKYKRSGRLTFMVSRFLFSFTTGLMHSRVLYKTNTCSLASRIRSLALKV
jgi:surface polysaccharide O-acyltransferase-like enzyme